MFFYTHISSSVQLISNLLQDKTISLSSELVYTKRIKKNEIKENLFPLYQFHLGGEGW